MGGACLSTGQQADTRDEQARPTASKQCGEVVVRSRLQRDLPASARLVQGELRSAYQVSNQVLGTGFSGPVRVAVNRETGRKYAVKTFYKLAAGRDRVNMLRNEAIIYLKLDHPNVARLIEVWEDTRHVHLLMELCSGGELYQRLCASKVYSEDDARAVTAQMIAAVQYIHSHNIVHRDLKLENWLYHCPGDSVLKLIDFGFSKIWNAQLSARMAASCGTLAYVSPDALIGGYTNACDLWSIGVIVYMLLVGHPPFYGTEDQMFKRILSANCSFQGPRWDAVSPEAVDFVRRLLDPDASRRMTASQATTHAWLRSETAPRVDIDIDVLEQMKQYADCERLKRAALGMMAYSLTTDEIKGMREVFLSFDRSGEGTIRVHELAAVMKKKLPLTNAEIEHIFRSMDSSGDHEVYYNDFLAVMLLTRLDMYEHLIRKSFKKFDTDDSGFISIDNLREILGSVYHERALAEIINEADRDCSGTIDYEEFLALMKSGTADAVAHQEGISRFASDILSPPSKGVAPTREGVATAHMAVVETALVRSPSGGSDSSAEAEPDPENHSQSMPH